MTRPRSAARRLATAAAVPWVLWSAVRVTGAERGFPLVPAMAFTPQAAVASVLPLGLALAARSRGGALLSLAAGGTLGAAALSARRQAQPPPTGPGADRLRVATVSLRRGLAWYPPPPSSTWSGGTTSTCSPSRS
jgi:hypothetical protein